MKFLLEFLDMGGSGFDSEEEGRIESDSPLPIPNVGDIVHTRKDIVEVVNRNFRYHGADDIHVYLHCKSIKKAPAS